MRTYPGRVAAYMGDSRRRIITPLSPEFSFQGLSLTGLSTSIAWPAANKPLAIPFRLSQAVTVFQLGWRNGSTALTDSFDVGIYDTSWNRLVSGGGTARGAGNSMQWVDCADTTLAVGSYYLACANNGTAANQAAMYTGALAAGIMALAGAFDSGTDAYPLPNPLTNMVAAATFTSFPTLGIACHVPF